MDTTDLGKINGQRIFHRGSRDVFEAEKKYILQRYIEMKVIVMHEPSLRILEKQDADMASYLDESEAVLSKALEEPTKFASSHEMVAAMELLRNEIRFKPEHRIGSRRVDFYV